MRLEGKVAIISGGARGMGAVEAKLFAREGASVIIGDLLEDEGHQLESDINDEAGGRAVFALLDVVSEANWLAVASIATTRFGRLDILVNNAGITGRGGIDETSLDDWNKLMDINAKGVFLGTKAIIPEMRKVGGGSIINISSQLGIVANHDVSPAYHASKGAVRLLTKATATQYANEGIRANSIHPGPVATAMTADYRSDSVRDQKLLSRIPMGRYGEPIEVANGVLYLASDESSYVTGSELVIDGGWTAQ